MTLKDAFFWVPIAVAIHCFLALVEPGQVCFPAPSFWSSVAHLAIRVTHPDKGSCHGQDPTVHSLSASPLRISSLLPLRGHNPSWIFSSAWMWSSLEFLPGSFPVCGIWSHFQRAPPQFLPASIQGPVPFRVMRVVPFQLLRHVSPVSGASGRDLVFCNQVCSSGIPVWPLVLSMGHFHSF